VKRERRDAVARVAVLREVAEELLRPGAAVSPLRGVELEERDLVVAGLPLAPEGPGAVARAGSREEATRETEGQDDEGGSTHRDLRAGERRV
jgi:hypothetical protein